MFTLCIALSPLVFIALFKRTKNMAVAIKSKNSAKIKTEITWSVLSLIIILFILTTMESLDS